MSLSAFFIALILAYSFRIESQQSWRHFQVPSLLWLSTLLLGVSSWILEAARYALRRAQMPIYRGRLLGTIGFGLLFVALQFSSGLSLVRQGVTTAANPHGSAFYVFMGIHGAHLLGGLICLTYLYVRSARLSDDSENELRKHRMAAGAAASYWHFMGALWAVLYYFLLRWTGAV